MTKENTQHSNNARRGEWKSNLAKWLHPFGTTHQGIIYEREEAFENTPIPGQFMRLSEVNDSDIEVTHKISPELYDKWAVEIANYRVPEGFESLEQFYDYFIGLVPEKDKKEIPYYRKVQKNKRQK